MFDCMFVRQTPVLALSAPCYRPQYVSITQTDVLAANPAEGSHSYVLIAFSAFSAGVPRHLHAVIRMKDGCGF